jgi:ArsR family transcriptional regulator, arsenate/arsenite/antimonite-responsive transcriptional repressor
MSGIVSASNPADVLAALAHDGRLAVLRLLCRIGPAGCPSGEVARALCLPPNTLSAQLAVLTRAGLVRRRPDGARVIYAAEPEALAGLILWLMTDACAGAPQVTAAVVQAMARPA